jgi:hypothetical protein
MIDSPRTFSQVWFSLLRQLRQLLGILVLLSNPSSPLRRHKLARAHGSFVANVRTSLDNICRHRYCDDQINLSQKVVQMVVVYVPMLVGIVSIHPITSLVDIAH